MMKVQVDYREALDVSVYQWRTESTDSSDDWDMGGMQSVKLSNTFIINTQCTIQILLLAGNSY